MCRCGVSCDYIYNRLLRAENDEKAMGFKLSVDMLFPGDESNYADTQAGDVPTDQTQLEV